ncbi:MAG: valine--tRNA ligase, partial [bacterium]
MGIDIGKRYNAFAVEEGLYENWLNKGYFSPENLRGEKGFTIVIPPPNVTDILHLGHALNNIIQDLLIRFKRMNGYRTLWVPGTDHAGIATQHMVELELARENLTREALGREKFLERLWQYKEEKGSIILEQLKEIGCSCDWTRTRFTMDPQLSRAVREAFCRLYEEGLIYRGKYIINWCPHCRTTLANDEVEHEEINGNLWYIFYPFLDSQGGVTVCTTRPETMLGDTAVAVHPDDERYKPYIGKILRLPLTNRNIPIIADKVVDRSFGTGAVKVTPAHDPVDFEIAKRHNLEAIFVIGEDGRMTKNAGRDFAGLDRFEARRKVVEALKEQGFILKIEPYSYAIGHCYRCHSIVEPYLSEQWFVKMKPLATPAIAVVEMERIKFYPERWKGVYLNWMENIQDWCISRQIWWGHQIPVWWCNDCGKETVSKETPSVCIHCGSERIYQDDDVLDTWFSSWLWPFSTLGWPDITNDLKRYYPTDVLVTGS